MSLFFKFRIIFIFLSGYVLTSFSQTVETVVQTGHYASVTAICYSYDGKFIATGSNDKTIKLWRVSDGKEIRSFSGISERVKHIEFNKAGSAILSVTFDGTILIYEVASGKVIKQFNLEEDKFTCASFSPKGLQIVTGTKKSFMSVRDIASGEKIMDIKAIPVDLNYSKGFGYEESKSVCYSTDGQFILGGMADKTAILWDAKSGKEIRKYKQSDNTCTSCVTEAQITSDNKYVISAGSDTVKVFDRVTGKLLKQLYNHTSSFSSLTVSADGRYVSAEEYGLSQVWDLKNGKLTGEFGEKSDKRVVCQSLSPDGRFIVTGNELRMADVWEISSGKKVMTLKGYLNQIDERILNNSSMFWASLISEAKLSADGRYIAVGRTGNNAKLIDFKTGKIRTLTGHSSMVVSLNFSNDGKYLVTGGLDGKAIVWDIDNGKPWKIFSYRDSNLAIFSVDISSDNQLLATADWAGYIVVWNMETGKMIKSIYPHGGMASYHVKFTSNGIYVLSAGLDRKLKLLEIETGEEVRTFIGHTDLVNSINVNATGDKIITSAWDGTYRVWDFLSGLQVLKVKAHKGGAYCAKFDNSGKFIISGGDDKLVKLWNVSTGSLLGEYAGHTGGVGDVNLTTDQKFIISGSRDGSIRFWNVEEKKEILSMVFINENDWFVKNPEGYFDATQGAFGSVSFVKGTELFDIGQFFTEFYRPGLYREMFETDKISLRQNISNSIESYPPPVVEVLSPDQNAVGNNNAVTVMVKVTNKGGGVKEFKVLQNGKRLNIDDSDVKRLSKEGQYAIKTFDLNLVPGNNEITVSAFSEGEIESASETINLSYKGLQKAANCYIFSIGINKYENENLNLTYARPDAEAFSDLVSEKGKKLFNKIYTYTLFDESATKDKVLAQFDEIAQNMKKEDVFVFFYAGHGSMVDNHFYFITSENTGLYQADKLKNAIYVKELQDKFKQLPALKQVVLIDACHSGSSVGDLAMRGADEEKALAQLSRSSGVHVMASSESQQQSAEIKSLGHGVFTWVLLQALQGKADGAPKDSKITIYELKSYIDDQVPEVSYQLIRHKQFPSTFSVGHDFPLVVQ